MEAIRSKRTVAFAAVWTLKYFHENVQMVDTDAVAELELGMSDARDAATPAALHLAAAGALMLGEVDSAMDFISAAVSAQSSSVEFLAMQGWIQLKAASMPASHVSLDDANSTFVRALSLCAEEYVAFYGGRCFARLTVFVVQQT